MIKNVKKDRDHHHTGVCGSNTLNPVSRYWNYANASMQSDVMPCGESHDSTTPPVSLQDRFLRVYGTPAHIRCSSFGTLNLSSKRSMVCNVSPTAQLLFPLLAWPQPRVITWLSKLLSSLSLSAFSLFTEWLFLCTALDRKTARQCFNPFSGMQWLGGVHQ